MSTPAGWYPDPQTQQPRYWDGQVWAPPSPPPPGYGGAPGPGSSATLPDGTPLAGWGRRLAAYLIDGVILGVIALAIGFPVLRELFSEMADYFEASFDAAEAGRPAPSSTQLQSDLVPLSIALGLIGIGVGFAYNVGMLLWKRATPGKLMLGMQVRLRDDDSLPARAILLRWAAQTGAPGLVGIIPFIGGIASIYTLLDGLWPLWDSQRQALHDKAARTNVVRVRP